MKFSSLAVPLQYLFNCNIICNINYYLKKGEKKIIVIFNFHCYLWSTVMQQFTNPSTGAITYQQFQIQSPVTSPAPKRRKSSIESAGGGK